jgi:UDP-N-acetylmuramoylalanine--D-glutamate ligase
MFAATLGRDVPCTISGDLESAVNAALDFALAENIAAPINIAAPVVLLSPAAASFDQFASFEVRGDRFRDLVADLGALHAGAGAAGGAA